MKILFILFLALLDTGLQAQKAPRKKKKSSFPYGTWMHSYEDDQDPNGPWLVYRPGSFNFPPSRGRSGIIVQKDGKFALIGPSPIDGRDTSWGSWKGGADGGLNITVPGTSLSRLEWARKGKSKLMVKLH